ncbi:MAG: TetR/AcrR family transcriptional regulator C-terminal domain-containing protein [Acidimicrobiales bacterium]
MRQAERPTLNREAIARAALELIDTDGLAGLSMRKLGSKLGVEAMSLYHYVANKGDLLVAAVEQLYLEIDISTPADPVEWEATVRSGLQSFRDTLARHPNAISLFASEPAVSPGAFGVFYAAYDLFRFAGLEPAEAHEALHLVVSFVLGHLMLGVSRADGLDVWDLVEVSGDTEPEVAAFIKAGAATPADDHFDFGLDTMIAGLRARFDLP